MYAIVEIAGQQFKVAKDQKVYVHRLPEEEGKKVTFDNVLLIDDGSDILIGAPAIDGAAVEAEILKHIKGDKVIVFKKKRRKGYRKKNGHRQYLTELVIESIIAKGAKKSAGKEVTKKETAPPEDKPEKAKAASSDKDTGTTAKSKSRKSVSKTPPAGETGKPKDGNKAGAAPKSGETEEISENLITRAEHRVEAEGVEINIDKLLHSVGTATKAEADDLKAINGIGPAYEKKLNEAGIYTYAQISKLKAADRDELSAIEGITREKIESEEWVKQAKELLRKK